MGKRRWIVWLVAGVVLLGCSGAQSVVVMPTGTATATGTTAPAVPSTIDATQVASLCGANHRFPYGAIQVGDLLVGRPAFALAYASTMLPDGTPAQPFKVDASSEPFNGSSPQFANTPAVNPVMRERGGGLVFDVCNTSAAQSHVVHSVAVRLESFTAYAGQLNAWKACDIAYSRQHPDGGGGCGADYFGDEYLHATFATTTAGTTAPTVQTGSGLADGMGSQAGPLPYSLPPGKTVEINIGLTLPTTAGTYTFAFGVQVDGAGQTFTPATVPLLFAPVAHQFAGYACATPAMMAQIPAATDPESYYVCPVP